MNPEPSEMFEMTRPRETTRDDRVVRLAPTVPVG
jgi:hypothetical protein